MSRPSRSASFRFADHNRGVEAFDDVGELVVAVLAVDRRDGSVDAPGRQVDDWQAIAFGDARDDETVRAAVLCEAASQGCGLAGYLGVCCGMPLVGGIRAYFEGMQRVLHCSFRTLLLCRTYKISAAHCLAAERH